MFKAPDPFIQPLEYHVLFDKITLDFRHCQIVGRIIPPEARERPVLDVCYSEVEAELEFIVQGDRVVCPVFRFVIGAAFAFQNAGLTIAGPLIPPVKIGQSVGMVCVLVQPLVIVDVVAAFLCIPVCRNRFEQMSHLQLVGIVFGFWLHAPLFDHPQFQRGRPR